jgi:hypothetical protein
MQIFPFAEDALANLRQAHNINYGTVNFLELLQLLRGYFWQVSSKATKKRSLSLILCTQGHCCNPPVVPRLCPSETAAGRAVQ